MKRSPEPSRRRPSRAFILLALAGSILAGAGLEARGEIQKG